MGSTRIFVAVSADGFIADAEGSVDWLAGFNPQSYGYDTFYDQVGAVILGRRTFEFTQAFGDWPYGDKKSFILTSQEMWNLPDNAVFVRKGLAAALSAARSAAGDRDIWIVGGAQTMQSALEANVIDMIDMFIVPTLLGSGLPLLSPLAKPIPLALESIETYQDGTVRLSYRPGRSNAST